MRCHGNVERGYPPKKISSGDIPVEPSWNLTSGTPRTPEPIWATPKPSAVGENQKGSTSCGKASHQHPATRVIEPGESSPFVPGAPAAWRAPGAWRAAARCWGAGVAPPPPASDVKEKTPIVSNRVAAGVGGWGGLAGGGRTLGLQTGYSLRDTTAAIESRACGMSRCRQSPW